MNRLARETERRMRVRDGSIAEVLGHLRRLEVEVGLLQAAGDAMRQTHFPCRYECKCRDCKAARQWDQVRKGDSK